jgi:hypothetical protein
MKWRGRLQYKLIGKLPVPCDNVIEWALAFERMEDRQVAKTEIGPLTVSTVFLGLDHGFGGRSLFFETLIFGDRDKLVDWGSRKRLFRTTLDYERRYETWDEAEKGHEEACKWAKAHLDKLDVKLKASSPSSPNT